MSWCFSVNVLTKLVDLAALAINFNTTALDEHVQGIDRYPKSQREDNSSRFPAAW